MSEWSLLDPLVGRGPMLVRTVAGDGFRRRGKGLPLRQRG